MSLKVRKREPLTPTEELNHARRMLGLWETRLTSEKWSRAEAEYCVAAWTKRAAELERKRAHLG